MTALARDLTMRVAVSGGNDTIVVGTVEGISAVLCNEAPSLIQESLEVDRTHPGNPYNLGNSAFESL
jgi:hypothetical protein